MWTEDWLIKTTRYYQRLGFFKDYIAFTDEQLTQKIIRLGIEKRYLNFGDEESDININDKSFLEKNNQYIKENLFNEEDYYIVDLDKKRVLSAATDILYAEEPPDYSFSEFVETLQRLIQISRGMFIPENIIDRNGVSIQFTLNNTTHQLSPEGAPDDPLILAGQINSIIEHTGYRFEQWDLRPDILLVVLKPEEKIKLEVERDWNFLNDRWMF